MRSGLVLRIPKTFPWQKAIKENEFPLLRLHLLPCYRAGGDPPARALLAEGRTMGTALSPRVILIKIYHQRIQWIVPEFGWKWAMASMPSDSQKSCINKYCRVKGYITEEWRNYGSFSRSGRMDLLKDVCLSGADEAMTQAHAVINLTKMIPATLCPIMPLVICSGHPPEHPLLILLRKIP